MDKSIYVKSIGSAYFDGSEKGVQPELKDQLAHVCRQRYRRIDRFIQLALLGAGRCAAEFELNPGTALYLATGKGPALNNIQMQEDIFRHRTEPKPIQFINAVSNSVGYYIMKEHSLNGQNLLVSREQHAFEAALALSAVDLHGGRCGSALLGMVDELSHPLEHQCRRLDVPLDTRLGEGSHWFLLSANDDGHSIGCVRNTQLFNSERTMLSWLPSRTESLAMFFGAGVNAELRSKILNRMSSMAVEITSPESLWDGINAGIIVRFLDASEATGVNHLLLISRDSDGRCQATLVERLVENQNSVRY